MSSNNKVIFLDVDGVLNSFRNILAFGRFPWPATFNNEEEAKQHGGHVGSEGCGPEWELDPLAIGMVRRLCELTGAKIVLHSMWRKHVDPFEFGMRHGLDIIDFTHRHEEKAHGIAHWLSIHPEVTHFVILDDDNIIEPRHRHPATTDKMWADMKENHIRTDMMDGMTLIDFANAFLALVDIDIDELRRDQATIALLRSANNAALGADKLTEDEIKANQAKLEELLKKHDGLGIWAVSLLIGKSVN